MLKRVIAYKVLTNNGCSHEASHSIFEALTGSTNDICKTKTLQDLYDYICDWVRYPVLDQHNNIVN